MAASDHLGGQFGKHAAKVTKMQNVTRPMGGGAGSMEVSASRKTPVDVGYKGKHSASKFGK
jgi:hypothetical protein